MTKNGGNGSQEKQNTNEENYYLKKTTVFSYEKGNVIVDFEISPNSWTKLSNSVTNKFSIFVHFNRGFDDIFQSQ